MRATWTDSRLDDFAAHTDLRFDAVDRRLDNLHEDMRELRGELGSLHCTIIQFGAAMLAAFVGLSPRFSAWSRLSSDRPPIESVRG